MSKLLFAILIALLAISCTQGYTSEAGRRTQAYKPVPDSAEFRVKTLFVIEGNFFQRPEISIMKVKSGYLAGDTVRIDGTYYYLISGVSRK